MPDEHEATKEVARQDETVDLFIDTVAAPLVGTFAGALAEMIVPGGGMLAGVGAASLVSRTRLALTRRLRSYAEPLAARGAENGQTFDEVLGGLDEEQGPAFHAAYESVIRAIDSRAAPALGRLVAEVIFDGRPRDAFFRDVGQLVVQADADEWDALELVGRLLDRGSKAAANTTSGSPPSYVKIISKAPHSEPGITTQVLVHDLEPPLDFSPAGEPEPPSWHTLMSLMVRTGVLPVDTRAMDGTTTKYFTLDKARRLASILVGP